MYRYYDEEGREMLINKRRHHPDHGALRREGMARGAAPGQPSLFRRYLSSSSTRRLTWPANRRWKRESGLASRLTGDPAPPRCRPSITTTRFTDKSGSRWWAITR